MKDKKLLVVELSTWYSSYVLVCVLISVSPFFWSVFYSS